tara:strand:- start:362 stop:562 length:201 start_codon:yes stop_codon:yes gene_type:complete
MGLKSSPNRLSKKTTQIGGKTMSINTDNQTDTDNYGIINKSFNKSFLVVTEKGLDNYNSANSPVTP